MNRIEEVYDLFKEVKVVDFVENGEKFTSLTHCGIREEGEQIKNFATTPKEAEKKYINELTKFCEKNKGDTLIWRKLPTVEVYDGKFIVYSRLRIE